MFHSDSVVARRKAKKKHDFFLSVSPIFTIDIPSRETGNAKTNPHRNAKKKNCSRKMRHIGVSCGDAEWNKLMFGSVCFFLSAFLLNGQNKKRTDVLHICTHRTTHICISFVLHTHNSIVQSAVQCARVTRADEIYIHFFLFSSRYFSHLHSRINNDNENDQKKKNLRYGKCIYFLSCPTREI